METSDSTTGAGRVFLPQWNRRFAVSGAHNVHKNSIFIRKDATSELDFEAENLRFRYKMWSNETALKLRKNPFLRPCGKSRPSGPIIPEKIGRKIGIELDRRFTKSKLIARIKKINSKSK